jgi:branched-chain amino acid transport system substrate-binding protein
MADQGNEARIEREPQASGKRIMARWLEMTSAASSSAVRSRRSGIARPGLFGLCLGGLAISWLGGCTSQISLPDLAVANPITTSSTTSAVATTGTPGTGGQAGSADVAAPAGRRGNIKIALLLPLSGSAGTAEVARGLRQAGELALVEFDNPAIVLSAKDTRGTADGAKTAAEEAIRDGAEIIIGPIFAKEVAAVSPVARAARVPVIAFSSDPSVAGNGTFLLSFLAGQDVPRVIGHATANGKRTFAALIPEGPYGRVLEASFREVVQASGGRVAAVQTYPADANGMLEPVKKIKDAIDQAKTNGAPVDALFMPAGQDTLPTLAPLLPYSNIDTRSIKLLGTSDWDFTNITREDVLSGGWYPAPDPKGWNDFAQRYSQAYNIMPPRLASVAYDAVSLVVSLSNNAPGQRFTESNLTRPSGFAGIDGLFRLKSNGRLERGLAILEVQKFGAIVANPAPVSFPAGANPAASASAGEAAAGGFSSYLPKLNFGGQAE